jgi:hypothetical protein
MTKIQHFFYCKENQNNFIKNHEIGNIAVRTATKKDNFLLPFYFISCGNIARQSSGIPESPAKYIK